MNYKEYLKSEHWLGMRDRILWERDYECQACGSGKNLNVHHLTYAHLGSEYDDELVVLCKPCHKAHHEGMKYDEAKKENLRIQKTNEVERDIQLGRTPLRDNASAGEITVRLIEDIWLGYEMKINGGTK